MSSPHPPSPSQSIRLRLFVLSSTICTDNSTTPVAIYWQRKDEDNSGRRISRVAIAEEGRDDSDGATSARASRLLRPSRRAAGKTHKKAAELCDRVWSAMVSSGSGSRSGDRGAEGDRRRGDPTCARSSFKLIHFTGSRLSAGARATRTSLPSFRGCVRMGTSI